MKRFYKLVTIDEQNGEYRILLDGKAVRTRSGKILTTPVQKIAEVVFTEWMDQKEEISPDSMPFTQILNTRLDRVSSGRSAIIAALLKYLDTDLICYFAPHPEDLKLLQHEKWEPFRKWFYKKYGYELKMTTALMAVQQSSEIHSTVEQEIKKIDDDCLTILQWVTALGGSLVMALALLEGGFTANDIYHARFVEEDYKNMISTNAQKNNAEPFSLHCEQTLIELEAAENYLRCLQ